MTVTESTATATIDDTDALQRVHHHCEHEDWARAIAGEPVTALCGLLKTKRPGAEELPCCPMCNEIIRSRDGICTV